MRIERLQVEEGFLDGLRLDLAPGLNVIIGARGVGKTSILEMIRYALRLEHVDQRRAASAQQHAEAILSGGRVLLTFVDNSGARVTVARSAADPVDVPSGVPRDQAPVVLGQNELEGIGLDQRSRLRLIDNYAAMDPGRDQADIGRLTSTVKSLTLQRRDLVLQSEALRQQELLRPKVEEELDAARAIEAALLDRAGTDAARLRERLGEQTTRQAQVGRELSDLESIKEAFLRLFEESESLHASIAEARSDLPNAGSASSRYLAELDRIAGLQRSVSNAVKELTDRVSADIGSQQSEYSRIDDEIRPLRREFEEFEVGAAAAAQATARLEQQLAGIDSGIERSNALEKRTLALSLERSDAMKAIEAIRESNWSERTRATELLNLRFEPRIRIRMEHYGDRSNYEGALAVALRGSGLQHNQLAEWLAERMSPQELVSAVEASDAAQLALIGELTSSRVEKLVNHLAKSDALGDILTSQVDDLVVFELLVGRDYRSSEQLSTGQRCAVVLPLLLADEDRVLLMDQPEDHLDNAYLVENTIKTLLARSTESQTIIATHNANIPVLGNAELVICLESDGRRGYIRHAGPLTDKPTVGLISDLMEGGREAFARRADFYRSWVARA